MVIVTVAGPQTPLSLPLPDPEPGALEGEEPDPEAPDGDAGTPVAGDSPGAPVDSGDSPPKSVETGWGMTYKVDEIVTGPGATLSGEMDSGGLTAVVVGEPVPVPLPVAAPLVPLPGAGNGAPEG